MPLYGFDSVLVKRFFSTDSNVQPFKCNLGIGVRIDNIDTYSKQYEQLLVERLKPLGIEYEGGLLKSRDLKQIGHEHNINVLREISLELIDIVGSVDVFYSWFKFPEETEDTTIGLYAEESEHSRRSLTPAEFVDYLQNPFPLLACYALLKRTRTELSGAIYYVDHCTNVEPSTATITVLRRDDVKVLHKGDQTNYAINAADIIARFIDEETGRKSVYFKSSMVSDLGLDARKIQTTFIGTGWLYDIRPKKKTELKLDRKCPHPTYYFFSVGEVPQQGVTMKKLIESSRAFEKACHRALKDNGSVKFFAQQDQRYITAEDYLVIHNDLARDQANLIKSLGCKARIIEANDL